MKNDGNTFGIPIVEINVNWAQVQADHQKEKWSLAAHVFFLDRI